MRRLAWVLGLLALIGGGAALAWTLAPRPSANLDIPRLQALATESCRCARTKPGEGAKRACWAQFERQIERHEPSRYLTACDPVSPSGYCFGDDPQACVVTEYSSLPDASLCSQDEARVAMTAFKDAYRRRRAGDTNANPDRAFVAVSQALARGDRLAASAGDGGCGS